jgi:HEXXH motif-containing protein
MPAYFRPERVAGDAGALIEAVDPGASTKATDLGRAYRTAVAKVQAQPFALVEAEEPPALHFDLEEPGMTAALRYLLRGDDAPSELELEAAKAAYARERFEAAWSLLEARAPEFLESVRILVGHFVFAELPELEGQTSLRNTLGTVFWISPYDNWKPKHFADAIVHESTHQALFLSDMVRGCFRVDRAGLEAPEALAKSSIREIPRPYDLAFHAACVDAVLLSLFSALGDEAEMRRRSAAVMPALEDLDGKSHLLTEEGRGVLDAAIATATRAEQLLA